MCKRWCLGLIGDKMSLTGLIIGLTVGVPTAIGIFYRIKEREENNQCLYCGAPYDKDAVYCSGCGKNLAKERVKYKPISRNYNMQNNTTKFCGHCGNKVDVSDSFCTYCGHKI